MDDQQIDRALMSALRRAKGPAAADVDVRDCVDAERLAAWSSGALSIDEAAEVERHLSACARCQEVAAVFAATVESAAAAAAPAGPASAPMSRIFRTWMAPLAAAAAVVVWFAWPTPERVGPPAPADTMARSVPPEPRAEVKAPALGSAPSPAPAQPTTSGGTAATPGQLARDQARERTDPATRSDSNRLADQQKLGQAMPPKTEPAFRAEPAAPAVTTAPAVSPPPPPLPAPPPAPATVPVAPPPPAAPVPVATPAPVVAAPPSPTMTQTAAAPTTGREFRVPAMAEEVVLNPRAVVAQFSSATPPGAAGGAVAGAGRGGAAGRGGGGGAPANRQITLDAVSATTAVPRWRVLASGAVERSTDDVTWSTVLINPPAHISGGAAPAPAICWLIGRGGVVLLSTNGQTFVRVAPPAAADLASIRADQRARSHRHHDRRPFVQDHGRGRHVDG